MSFILDALRDKPLGLWLADTDSPFRDYSGYGRNGNGTGTHSIALVAGAAQSFVAETASFESPVFIRGYEDQPFSLEAAVYPVEPGEQQILGHAGEGDGLVIDGSQISFVTKYANSGEARATFDLQSIRACQAMGVHTADKNSLYVDGVLVAEVSISEEQKVDEYIATDGTLSSSGVAINGIGIYAQALKTEAVVRHYRAGRRNVGNGTSTIYGGQRIPLSYEVSDVFLRNVFTTENDWNSGHFQNIVVENDTLLPQIINGTSTPGEWLTSIDLYDGPNDDQINSVSMFWDGEGAIVETTVDDTWAEATRGMPIESIPEGFYPTDTELQVRVRFPGGIEEDESFLDNLTVIGLKTDTSTYFGVEVGLAQPVAVRNDYEAVELRSDWGALLSGGSVTLSTPLPAKTVEVWVKPTGDFTTNLTPDTTYTNGGPEAPLVDNQWQVRHYVVPAGVSTILFSGYAQIGQVVLYPDELTAETVANVYSSYFGRPMLAVDDNSSLAITESVEAVDIYAYDWSIEAAG